jgi:FixJ family two-component response regulator
MTRAAMALTPSPRLIYMSAHGEASLRREGMPAGNGFLAKPFTSHQLRDALDAAFATRRSSPRHTLRSHVREGGLP